METYLEGGSASADKSTLMERVMTLFYGKVLRGGGNNKKNDLILMGNYSGDEVFLRAKNTRKNDLILREKYLGGKVL